MARLARILEGRIAPLLETRVLKGEDYARLEQGESLLLELAREQQRARQEAARALDEQRQRGYEEGLAKAEAARARQAFETVSRAIRYFESMEEDMVALLERALDKIAEGIDKDKLVRHVVARALRDYRSLPQITLHIARSQEKALHKDIERLTHEARLAGMVKIAVNARLQEGSCLLESPLGTVELGLASQIAALKEALGALRNRSAQESETQESKTQESKTQEGKTEESKTQEKATTDTTQDTPPQGATGKNGALREGDEPASSSVTAAGDFQAGVALR